MTEMVQFGLGDRRLVWVQAVDQEGGEMGSIGGEGLVGGRFLGTMFGSEADVDTIVDAARLEACATTARIGSGTLRASLD
jgi:hypothetical protein